MLRIFVTGDNHIGLKYASHEQSAVLASSRITAFENMVKMPLFICFLGYNKVYVEKGFSANNKF